MAQCGTLSGLTTRSKIKPGWVASGLPEVAPAEPEALRSTQGIDVGLGG